jgi:hypothetical protein
MVNVQITILIPFCQIAMIYILFPSYKLHVHLKFGSKCGMGGVVIVLISSKEC